MRTARETVCKEVGCNALCPGPEHQHTTLCAHNVRCNALTAAIEARDAEHEAEAKRLKGLIDRDRTGLAAALVEVKKRAEGGRWISEGRGSYKYDEDDYRKETGWLVADVVRIASDALRASGNLANEAFHPTEARATLSRQGEGDVVERVLAVECPTCGTELGTPCDDFGGDRHVFCASRLRASTPTPAPTDVARAALERIAAEKCAYDGSYDSCAEAEEDGDFTGTCAVCIARAALGRTPAPLLEGPRLRDDQRLNELLLDYAASWAANQASFEICQRRRHETLDAIQARLGSAPRRPGGGK